MGNGSPGTAILDSISSRPQFPKPSQEPRATHIRAVRRTFAQPGDFSWRTEAAQAFESRGLSSRQILQTHFARAAGDLPTS